ncbi:hypothetical protein S40293_06325 [Stachybotrys chartarum IBT 40293]|nr:hypothetical protein S40293_06325 [Stachybotrys chartarum IBT 40293]
MAEPGKIQIITKEQKRVFAGHCLEAVWKHYAEQHVHPFTQVLTIDHPVFMCLDDEGRRFFAQKFMDHVREPVMFVCDATNGKRWFLGPPKLFIAGGGMLIALKGAKWPYWTVPSELRLQTTTITSMKVPAEETRVRRPPNAYILYRRDRHNIVKQNNPGITNNEISSVLGRAWQEEDPQVRAEYSTMARQIKEALLEKYPDYQYRPRRAGEKKTRRSRRATVGTRDPGPQNAIEEAEDVDEARQLSRMNAEL